MPHSSLHNILKNPKYYGKYEFKGTINMNFIPPLVSKETFDKAQVIMHENPKENRLRILTPVECERINQFPDNWTNSGMPEKRRYFMMGNALVCGIIKK